MAKGPRYNVPMRRRREGITNYHQRLPLLKSGTSRMVVRISNKYISVQLINLGPIGDETVVSVSSKDLLSYGWKAPLNNLPSSYLTGLLIFIFTSLRDAWSVCKSDCASRHHHILLHITHPSD